ncbi:MAG: hypothetical protein B6D63_03635 [Candidatus Latescibacteria bacterium 4484_7]|nr:MAG: hypothetical protein B6D63_03635 [Candidatus Latescibacteria bacterium 4484_7]RKZ06546.1 MAG: hypothetical protein DRQ05_04590 [bacterium]
MHYDALAIGENEIRFGIGHLLDLSKKYGLPLLSTNLLYSGSGKPIGSKYIIEEVGGTRGILGRKGSVKIGIFSVILPFYAHSTGEKAMRDYDVLSPKVTAMEAVSSLKRSGCNLIVAVSHQGWRKSIDLAKSVDGIDIVINAHRAHDHTYSERTGKTLVVDAGDKRMSFSEIIVTFKGDSLFTKAIDSYDEVIKTPRNEYLDRLYREYDEELEKAGLK